MNKKSSLIKFWLGFFIPIFICNVLIFLIYTGNISLNFEGFINGANDKDNTIDYMFYALLGVTVIVIFFQLFILDKLKTAGVNNNIALPEEKNHFGKIIIKISFAASVGIYCLIFFLISGQAMKSLIFGAISLIMFAIIYFEIENNYNKVR